MHSFYQLAALLLLSFAYPSVAPMAQTAQALGTPAKMAAASPFTIAVSSAPRTLDPATATDAAGARLLQLTHPALLRWGPGYTPTGLVAESCTQPTLATATCTLNP